MAVLFGPSLWVRSIMRKYQAERGDFPGSGGELARHLLDKAGLDYVRVEETPMGDHYDPKAKAVRLTPPNFTGRSLTAVTVATHEVGHALQDRDDYGPLRARTQWVLATAWVERVGPLLIMAAPFIGLIVKSPAIGLLSVATGLLILAGRIIVHAFTLPTEFDASFNRALPILDQGDLIPKDDLKPARRILTAAALTYLAGAMMSLVDIIRWLRYLR
ncbi:MAG: zinc metallopeptidase [Pseudomonadota bacterium]